ncbi:MAG: M42 family metallopeptidase [Clostridia bacterium]|nr:M42 family metallopeptidase [Clostridia bacterium]
MDKYMEYALEQLKTLVSIPSPSGMTREATDYLLAELTRLGFRPQRTRKGTVTCDLGGTGHGIAISSHVDTLGAMVRSVKSNGCLRLSQIGGYNYNAIENENVLIHTRDGRVYSGTVQSTHASLHVWSSNAKDERTDETVEVVVDEEVRTAQDTKALGIDAGCVVSFDPRFVVTKSGFVKSRFLDDKCSASLLLALARQVADGAVTLARNVILVFTVYEEEGHGASALYGMPVEDFIAVDMGCVGDDLNCHETELSICAKDSASPYDFDFTNELIDRAKRLSIPYAVDIYPRYGSDCSTVLKAGLEARFACCGQGVFASHGYERTHIKGMQATLALIGDLSERVY